jgi:hypothetical protein
VGNFIHGDLKLTLLLSHMLKINKNRKCYAYKKLKIKKRKKEKFEPVLKTLLFSSLPPSSFIFQWLILMVWRVVYLLVL